MCAAIGIERDGSSPRAAAPRRRFQIADAMILVAATAMGCGLMLSIARMAKRSPYDWFAELISQEPWYDLVADSGKITALALLTMPLVVMVTLALLPIWLVGTRLRFRRLARRPGLMASCASSLAMVFLALPVLVGALAGGVRCDGLSRLLALEEGILSATIFGGLAVLVSWMTLVVGGRWRSEATWLDRLGRAMGLYWIMAAFAVWAAQYLLDISTTHCGFGELAIRNLSDTPVAAVGRKIQQVAVITMPPVALASLVLLAIRLVGTRPRFRRLARQPGLMALCASGLVMALIGLQLLVTLLAVAAFVDDGVSWEDISALPSWLLDEQMVMLTTRCGGFAVLVSWTTLVVGRRWCVERSWGDRLGRVLGFCWILAAFAVASVEVLMKTDYERYVHLHPETRLPVPSDPVSR
jgi:hypothetical protein